MARRRWRPWKVVNEGQSVVHSTVGGDVIQIGSVRGNVTLNGEPRLDLAARRLAESARKQWTREAKLRSVWQPAPLPVRWSSTGRPVQAAAEVLLEGPVPGRPLRLPLHGQLTGISETFHRLPHRQLVVLGEPGSGKTVLAMQLVLDLLRHLEPGDPVPVLFSLSSYRPAAPLQDWMVARLVEDHQFLTRTRVYGRDAAARLIETGRVLPVLDGLDEISPRSRALAIAAIDREAADQSPLVVTCRSAEYETAVTQSGHYLTRAAVVEIDPVDAELAVRFLRSGVREGDQRWRPVLEGILSQREGPLARAFTTPLMLFLARATYTHPATDPAELLNAGRFGEREQVEDHLLASFVPAVYAAHHAPRYQADKAGRWLAFLARGQRDLRWWQFKSPIVNTAAAVIFALGSGWVFSLAWGPIAGIVGGAAVGGGIAWSCQSHLYKWAEIAADDRTVANPRANLRRHRMLAALWATAAGLGFGALMGVWFAGGFGANPGTARRYAVTLGVTFGLGTLVSTAWGGFVLTRLWYAMTGRVPFRLLNFFDDAHQRGVLRQSGPIYEFRHARLQDRLRAGKTAIFRTEVKSVSPSGFRKIFTFVPLLRLGVQLYAILIPAVIITGLLGSTSLVYKSGQRPGTYLDFAACGTSQDCNPPEVWWWRVPQGPAVTSRFTPGQRSGLLPFSGFGGTARIGGCERASIVMTVQANTARGTLRIVSRDGELPLDKLDGKLPADITTLTITFRRLDTDPCPGRVDWTEPSLSTDAFFNLRNRLR